MVGHALDRIASLDTAAMMPRVFRNAAYFIVGVMLAFLALMPFAAHAYYTSPSSYELMRSYSGGSCNTGNILISGATLDAVCNDDAARANSCGIPNLTFSCGGTDGNSIYTLAWSGESSGSVTLNTSPICSTGSLTVVNGVFKCQVTCPSGQIDTGSGCSCPSGQSLVGGTCLPDCQTGTYRAANGECIPVGQCPLGQAWSEVTQGCVSCSSVSGGGQNYSYPASSRDASGNVCVGGAPGSNGCYLATTGTNVCVGSQCYGNLGAGTGVGCVVGPQAGSNANQNNPAVPTPPSNDPQGACTASGGYYGTVNGQSTCVPASNTTPVTATTKTNTTTTSPTNTTTTNTTKTTSVSNSVATTTTVTQTTVCDPNGQNCTTTNTTSTGTGSTYDPQDLCAKHPDIPACRHWCEDHPDKVACKSLNELIPDPTVDQEPGTKQLGVASITPQSFGGAASCPGSISVTHGAYLSFDWICNLMGAVKPMLLALAWLSAGLITIGAFRDG